MKAKISNNSNTKPKSKGNMGSVQNNVNANKVTMTTDKV